jgi:hypothetical protein
MKQALAQARTRQSTTAQVVTTRQVVMVMMKMQVQRQGQRSTS